MKLITKSSQLSKTFIELNNTYANIAFATAWANSQHSAFQNLLNKNKHKIRFSTIGLHFYQTDPKVLTDFQHHDDVRFIKQTNGVFHPKFYLFWNNEFEWTLLIGSANFTNGAFIGENQESTVLINSKDGDNTFFHQSIEFLNDCFKQGDNLSTKDIERYCHLHKLREKEKHTLSNQYIKSMTKSILSVDVLNYSWQEYYHNIQKDPYHGFKERLDILDNIHQFFTKHNSFADMSKNERKFIAGIDGGRSGWFGSMIGNGKFKNAINENTINLAQAIDMIPLNGKISQELFFDYIQIYQSTPQFIDKPNSLATATRLLSMKRPDLFICFNSKNHHKICEDLGIRKSKITAEHYWFDVLQRFYDTAWFNSLEPQEDIEEKQAWRNRMALLDCLYYET